VNHDMWDVWVEVDLAALRHNTVQIRSTVGQNVKLMAVVKANGYGHGMIEPSKAFLATGANALAVTRLDEAFQLRQAGIDSPLLVFSPIQPARARDAVEADLELTVDSAVLVQDLSAAAVEAGRQARIHVKVDTGMGRLGLLPKDVPGFFDAIKSLPGIEVAGIYTHFANASERDTARTLDQLQVFQNVLGVLDKDSIQYGDAHAANSAGLLRLPDSHLDMVRPGTLLYGQYPSAHVPHCLDLKNTWTLKARISDLRELPRGTSVGYGSEFVTRRRTLAAVIPVGYADGFGLTPEGPVYRQSLVKFAVRKRRRPHVFMKGSTLPVLGRVAMQMCVVDVTDLQGVKIGDEVVIPARRIPAGTLLRRVYSGTEATGESL